MAKKHARKPRAKANKKVKLSDLHAPKGGAVKGGTYQYFLKMK